MYSPYTLRIYLEMANQWKWQKINKYKSEVIQLNKPEELIQAEKLKTFLNVNSIQSGMVAYTSNRSTWQVEEEELGIQSQP